MTGAVASVPDPDDPVEPSRNTVAAWMLSHAGLVMLVGGGFTVVCALFGVFVAPYIPALVGRHLAGGDLADARDAIRGTFLKLATGVGAATAGVLAWARLDLSRHEHRRAEVAVRRADETQRLAIDAQRLAEVGQVTERYTRAVEQLGSANHAVRLGAIYALERLARDSSADRATIFDVVCAWIRHHSVQRDATGEAIYERDDDDPAGPDVTVAVNGDAVDYRAALTVVLRADPDWRLNRRDLSGAVISNLDVSGLIMGSPLDDVDFAKARLYHVDFAGVSLSAVSFQGASLYDVSFIQASLANVRFATATLHGAAFEHARLEHVDFQGARLSGSSPLVSTDFESATLIDVEFRHASLSGVDFGDATLRETRFGFVRLDGVDLGSCREVDPSKIRPSELVSTTLPDTWEPSPGDFTRDDRGRWNGKRPRRPLRLKTTTPTP